MGAEEQSNVIADRVAARCGAATTLRLALAAVALLAALLISTGAASAASTPAWQLSVVHGPTNVPIEPAANEVQTLTIEGEEGLAPNLGKFRLEFTNPEERASHTKYLHYDAPAEEVQEALEAMRSIGPGNVTVTGGPKGEGETKWSYTITFVGELAGQELELIEAESEETEGEEKRVEKEGKIPNPGEAEVTLATNGSHDTVVYDIVPTNTGGATTAGKITVKDTLPPHLSTTHEPPHGSGWTCTPEEFGSTSFTCTREAPVNPAAEAPPILVEAYADATALTEGQQLTDKAEISGGGAAPLATTDTATVSDTPAQFGIVNGSFTANAFGPGGEKATQAGEHPYSAMTGFFFNTVPRLNTQFQTHEIVLPGNLKDADVTLPAGFVGNPAAVPKCTQSEFTEGTIGGPVRNGHCAENTRVGTAYVYYNTLGSEPEKVAFYNLEPPPNAPAEFGFVFKNVAVRVDGHLVREPNGEYRVGVLSADVNEAFNIIGVSISLWGVPGDTSHDAERGEAFKGTTRPFLTNPTDCVASSLEPPTTTINYDRWEQPGLTDEMGLPVLGANWLEAQAAEPAVTGCDKLKFEPTIAFQPETTKAAAPSGYGFELNVPNNEEPSGLAVPELKDTTVTLPPGVSLSPSAANGLTACTDAQIDVASTSRGSCPETSQVGTVSIVSQLLESPLSGRVYVGEPECSPCSPADAESGRLFRLFIEAEGSGVRVKLPGTASVNQATGQISTSFLNNPQTPFTSLKLKLKGGERATLANPTQCGSYELVSALTPWSVAGTGAGGTEIPGDPVADPSSIFAIDWDGSGGACPGTLPFEPSFNAGTESSTAGAYSPLDVVFKRGDDREQDLAGTTVSTPPGLLGKIAGVTRCAEPLAAAGTCPESSRIATATSVAGSGTQPFVVSGPVYLTDSYKGEPFGLSIAVPAKAGPFNLGTVVVRAAIAIEKRTSAITITSDPLPQSVDGVPFRLKEVDVKVDRPEFMFNATNCEPKAITATISGALQKTGEAAGAVTRSAPYTPSGCAALPFGPAVNVSVYSKASRLNGTSFSVTVAARHGEANIHKVELSLPKTVPSRESTLHGACPDTIFAVNPAGCPAYAVVGSGTAVTPLLSAPLSGPAYLVSHGGAAFPDLVFLLSGEGVEVELVGNTEIDADGVTHSRFEAVPDAPVTSFTSEFPAGPHSLLSAYGNICIGELLAPTRLTGQNGALVVRNTKINVTGCPPTVSITSASVHARSVSVHLNLSAAGTVTISGAGLRRTSRHLSAGAQTVTVALGQAGLAAKRRHRTVKLSVVLHATGGAATKAKNVRL